MSPKRSSKSIIGISIGDLNGIGYEVILKTLADSRINDLAQIVIYGSKDSAQYYQKLLNLDQLKLNYIKKVEDIKGSKAHLLEVWKDKVEIEPGKANAEAGKYAFKSLEAAVKDLKEGHIDALVTAPINKKTIQSEDFNFPGHTEYLQATDEAEDSLMLMLSEKARIGVITGHIPLKDVASTINTDLILRKLTILNRSLKEDFSIRQPKIAILGLNPHAGDNGLLGEEEIKEIQPAIQQAKSIEVMAFGPFPADGFFGSSEFLKYDGILAMYHDQGLIPAKSMAFGEGTNFTAGLSFIRTSPDHGTAFAIAGKGEADESSFRNALYRAIEISGNRKMNQELLEGQFSPQKNRK
ncbi:MAG: 4-hydroxythreonine-4-phosphate dehydrogenase PdxA [Flavobacteriales bacterium]|nr:4-hydroxythreonine-4-phosphate dehydrogenase PdxA [Flavobacteriales bacterium]